ncbi:hypothetical protein K458DRAFT_170350 [Lentithecium fluviatile CBS 122367]|uniref:Uncharacterized protein n=1 Tax=Lentithecium fluviatile CBS 122367 TaxID=1168545 RepID=A0A6G1JB53_9PLEO|nr:hypothetical protein K458DRAFT_170350 [Lentithecium fluviatile CBS 122367]
MSLDIPSTIGGEANRCCPYRPQRYSRGCFLLSLFRIYLGASITLSLHWVASARFSTTASVVDFILCRLLSRRYLHNWADPSILQGTGHLYPVGILEELLSLQYSVDFPMANAIFPIRDAQRRLLVFVKLFALHTLSASHQLAPSNSNHTCGTAAPSSPRAGFSTLSPSDPRARPATMNRTRRAFRRNPWRS